MSLLRTISSAVSAVRATFVEALFPLSPAEKELFSWTPEQAADSFKKAPPYDGLATPLPEARSLFAYKDVRVEKLIWNIKYKKSAQAVEIGGYALSVALARSTRMPLLALSTQIILVPMPITKRRRRERGFNQCEILLDEIQRLDIKKEFIYEKNLLIRTHHDGRHTLKGRADRVQSAKGIFGVNEETLQRVMIQDARFMENAHIVVIDDVITTGSTMREAVDTLKNAGFKDIRALSLAH